MVQVRSSPFPTTEGLPQAPQAPQALLFSNMPSSSNDNSLESCTLRENPSSRSLPNAATICNIFKNILQEYAKKVGIGTPAYATSMEGRSHAPTFRSTVIVNNVRYDSLSGFSTRKAAEQSAAEVALLELTKSGQMKDCIPVVYETGLCKNLLQEYVQEMNYAIPSYKCSKQLSGTLSFTSTVEFDGFQYIGAAARTKKEAEINAGRIALLAIQSPFWVYNTSYNVLPGKIKSRKKGLPQAKEAKHLKPNKTKFKKKKSKRRKSRKNDHKFAKSSTGKTRDINLDALILSAENAESSGTEEAHKVRYLEMVHKVMKLQLEDLKGPFWAYNTSYNVLPGKIKNRKKGLPQAKEAKHLKPNKTKFKKKKSKRRKSRKNDHKFAKSSTGKTRDINLDALILSAGDTESSGAEEAHKIKFLEMVHKVMKLQLEDLKGASRICTEGASICTLFPCDKKGRKAEKPQPEAAKKLKPKKTKLSKNGSKRRLKRRNDQKFAKSIKAKIGDVNVELKEDHTVKYLEMLQKVMKLQLQEQEVQENGLDVS